MVEVGIDLWRSSGPTHLLKQGHLEMLAQDPLQTDSEYLHNLSGKSLTVLSHPPNPKAFSDFIASGPVTGTTDQIN